MQTLPASSRVRPPRPTLGERTRKPITWSQPVPYSVHAHYDLKAFSLFGISLPRRESPFRSPSSEWSRSLLALLAVTALWRDSRVRLLAALALAAILYALGHNSVFQGASTGLSRNSTRRARLPPRWCSSSSHAPHSPPSGSIDSLHLGPPAAPGRSPHSAP